MVDVFTFLEKDIINASFELVGAFMTLLNVHKIYQHKMVRGVSVYPSIFYTSWGAWNIYFYPASGFILSGIAGALLFFVNVGWLSLYWKYRRN